MNWRLIKDVACDGAQNMARDEALLWNMKAGDAPVLRFYSWNPACLSLGRFQKIDEVAAAATGEIGIDWVRRPTGGRAVWHQHEITYSIVLREELLPPDERSVTASYRRISEGFLEGLQTLGIRAQIAPTIGSHGRSEESSTGNRKVQSPNCFDAATRADFVVDGRKLLGAAQCRKNGAILQHGSLLLDVDEQQWMEHAGGLMSQIVTLKSLGVTSSREEIVEVLCQGLQQKWKMSFDASATTARETATANFLCEEKYRTESWNACCRDVSPHTQTETVQTETVQTETVQTETVTR